jgi:hypothetical protein
VDVAGADFGRLAVALPSCEALMAGTVEERRAIIATLVRRGDADAVAMLRWALGASDPDLAVDAALALEEMTASFDVRLAACRDALAAARGTGEAASAALPAMAATEAGLAAADLITHAIEVGVVDPALVPVLAAEAREDFEIAAGDAAQADAVAVGRTLLELLAMRPDTALTVIDAALPRAGAEARQTLLAYREEAQLASHTLPWEGPSALATYHVRRHSQAQRLPPPLTARRRLGVPPVPAASGSIQVGPIQIPGAAATRKVRRAGR